MGSIIKAEVIADSLSMPIHASDGLAKEFNIPTKDKFRATTFVLTYPRMIHAEFMTHRVFGRNAASSRAIPSLKMMDNIRNDMFIPLAWQKDHKGMQGTQYIEDEFAIRIEENEWKKDVMYELDAAKRRHERGVTKQIINRRLEDAMWYKCIVTATEYENFFELRCPQYQIDERIYKSRRDAYDDHPALMHSPLLDWLKVNKSGAEIHISLLAEAMWDAMNESTPKLLKPGEWHIPFGGQFDDERIKEALHLTLSTTGSIDDGDVADAKIKIATARCARVSYLNYEGKDDYEADIKLYDRLLNDGHMSPFEHCLRAMDEDEFWSSESRMINNEMTIGWCGNVRGFMQLRKELPNEYRKLAS